MEVLVTIKLLGELVKQRYQLALSCTFGQAPPFLLEEPMPLVGWDGKCDPLGALRRSVWVRIVCSCLRHRINPYVALGRRPPEAGNSDDFPPPEAFIPDRWDRRTVKRMVKSSERDASFSFQYSFSRLRDEIDYLVYLESISIDQAAPRVLRNNTFGFSKLLRYSLAFRGNLGELARKLLEPATLEFIFGYEVNRLLYNEGDLPETLGRHADEVYSLVDSGLLEETGGDSRG